MSDLDFSYNSINASSVYFEAAEYIDDLLPEQDEVTIDIPKISGVTQLLKKFKPRDIAINGVLKGTTKADLLTRADGLKEFLYNAEDQRLIFNDKTDRFYMAQFLRKIKLQKRGGGFFAPLRLEFRANDPFGYAVTADSTTVTNKTKGYTWSITNSGQYYAFPIITVTFHQSQTHFYIANNDIVGCRIDITKAFANTNVLVIDTKAMSIKLNTVRSPAGIGDGGSGKAEFIILSKGTDELEIGTDDATLNVDVNVWFRKTYL